MQQLNPSQLTEISGGCNYSWFEHIIYTCLDDQPTMAEHALQDYNPHPDR